MCSYLDALYIEIKLSIELNVLSKLETLSFPISGGFVLLNAILSKLTLFEKSLL